MFTIFASQFRIFFNMNDATRRSLSM